jgi:SAM-dependent methyltransferase
MTVDFGRTADDYAAHRAAFAPALFERLRRDFGIGRPGQSVLDLGAGTGLLARGLATAGCDVIQLDVSPELLSRSGSAQRVVGRAEALPFGNNSFDVVAAAQCWHWFDRSRAPVEISRVLRHGGTLAVVYQTYVPLPGSVAEATERLILRHRPGWRHANSAGVNGQVLRDVQAAGFVGIESFSFDVEVAFTRERWRGFVRTTSAVGASMPAEQLRRFDDEHEAMLRRDWPDTLVIPHRVFAAVARKPAKPIMPEGVTPS